MKKLKVSFGIFIQIIMPFVFYFAVSFAAENFHSICIFKNIFGFECWGCGITHAFNSLFHLNFMEAFSYNPLIIVVAPLIIWVWLNTLIKKLKTRDI